MYSFNIQHACESAIAYAVCIHGFESDQTEYAKSARLTCESSIIALANQVIATLREGEVKGVTP